MKKSDLPSRLYRRLLVLILFVFCSVVFLLLSMMGAFPLSVKATALLIGVTVVVEIVLHYQFIRQILKNKRHGEFAQVLWIFFILQCAPLSWIIYLVRYKKEIQ